MMRTLFLNPPSYEGFDGGAGARYQAKREIRSYWYPTWLAQPAALVPGLEEIIQLRAPGLLGCVLSGAGPSVLVFYEKGCEEVCDLVRQIFKLSGHESETLRPSIDVNGYQIHPKTLRTK